ncbi:hypothetical protein HC891_19080 [Candidatus Gracilibacteria bacterium]|nr:hypothetical protein [Candidatus Gracilibacteria bacterium]
MTRSLTLVADVASRCSCFLLAVPEQAHLGATLHQLVECADRFDLAVLEHDNLVGAAQRCPAVGDDKAGDRGEITGYSIPGTL